MQITNHLMRSEPDLPQRLLKERRDHGSVTFSLEDGKRQISTKQGILNMLLWYPLLQAGMNVSISDIFVFDSINNDKIAEVNTHIYHRLMHIDLTKTQRLNLIWQSINNLHNTIILNLNEYHQTIDAIGLSKIREHEKIKPHIHVQLDSSEGSAAAENKLNRISNTLYEILSDPKALPENQLLAFMCCGNIKKGQLHQVFAAYGPRSDVNGTIKKHFVSESAMSGLKNVYDYAIETLAAKKSQKESTDTIRDSQSFGRILRIACSKLKYVYKGWCGNTTTVPFYINEYNASNCLWNTIVEKNKRIILTPDNIEPYINSWVNLVSPIPCNYTDGFCEGCAGWGFGMASEYLPNVNIGTHSGTRFVNKSSQTILSSKHQTSTDSKEYTLNEKSKKYFFISGNAIYLHKKMQKENVKLKVPLNDLRPITDLQESYGHMTSSFSRLKYLQVVDGDNNLLEELDMEHPFHLLYFSKSVLDTLSKAKNVEWDELFLYIPFQSLPVKQPVIRLITLSQDMSAFIREVRRWFLSPGYIEQYSSVTDVLNNFGDTIYGTMSINVFYLQVILKACLVESRSSEIPVVDDIDNVKFGKVGTLGHLRGEGMQLALGNVKALIEESDSYIMRKAETEYDGFFDLKK